MSNHVEPYMPGESTGQTEGPGRLKGRRILIIGGGQDSHDIADPPIGNGRAMSVLFAREGAHVAVADRSASAAQATCDQIKSEDGAAFVIEADVTSPSDIQRMIADATAKLGGLDGLVYNVGVVAEMWLTNITPEGWDKTFSANLRGAALALKEALPEMADNGAVVLISSLASLKPGSRLPAYDASKAALAGLMRHAALEGARKGIRANVIAPGLIDTSLGRLATKGRPGRAKTPVPLGRQGTGWEVANAALFLISDAAAYITGQVLSVDGGMSTLG